MNQDQQDQQNHHHQQQQQQWLQQQQQQLEQFYNSRNTDVKKNHQEKNTTKAKNEDLQNQQNQQQQWLQQQQQQLQQFYNSRNTDSKKNHQEKNTTTATTTSSSSEQSFLPTFTVANTLGVVSVTTCENSKIKNNNNYKQTFNPRTSAVPGSSSRRCFVDNDDTATPEQKMVVRTNNVRSSSSSSSFHPTNSEVASSVSAVNNTTNDNHNNKQYHISSLMAAGRMSTDECYYTHNNNNYNNDTNNQQSQNNEMIYTASLVPEDANENITLNGINNQISHEEDVVITASAITEINEEKDDRKWYICICLTLVILIGVIIGSIVGMRRTINQVPIVDNSFCNQSIPIELDGNGIIGSIFSTSKQMQGNNNTLCGVFDNYDADNEEEEEYYSMIHGRWFSYVGNGSSVIASTCSINTNFDTHISIYSGSSCNKKDDLTCIDWNDNNPIACCAIGNKNCEQKSAVTWSAFDGIQYYIFVHSVDANDDVGEFELKLTSIHKDINNVCQTAISIPSTGIPISGSNELVTIDNTNNIPTCGNVIENGPGLWYKVKGIGGFMIASTCNDDDDDDVGTISSTTSSLLDTQISIFVGSCSEKDYDSSTMTSGKHLQCVVANDNDNCGRSSHSDAIKTRSRVTWESVVDETYYIYIHGKDNEQRGTFHLSVDTVKMSDQLGECLSKNIQLAEIPDIGMALGEFNANFIRDINFDNVCQQQSSDGEGIVCTIDLSKYDQSINEPCIMNGGRYIQLDVELICGGENDDENDENENGNDLLPVLILRMMNYPNCISILCNDDRILSILESQFQFALSTLQGQGISCKLENVSFER